MDTLLNLYTHYQHMLFDPDRVPLAMAAVLLVSVAGMVTGPVCGNANPFFWIVTEKILGGAGVRLDRTQRGARDLIMRGFFLTVAGLLLAFGAGHEADRLAAAVPLKGMTEVALLALTMTAGSVWFALLRFYFAVSDKKTGGGKTVGKNIYYTVAVSTRTDLSSADEFTMTRVGMGMAARAFDRGVVAPVLWYLIGGLPAAYIYAGLAALAWRFGRDGFTHGFGKVALALEQVMGFVPAAFGGALMAGAGLLTPTGGMTRAVIGLLRPERRIPHAEGGPVVMAMADALSVALGGPTVDLDGRAIPRAWAGPKGATAKLGAGHLRRALYIAVMAHLLFLAALGTTLFLAADRPAKAVTQRPALLAPAGLSFQHEGDHPPEAQPLHKN